MSKRYKVVIVGMGQRGKHHAAAFKANGRFEIAGICDIDEARLAEVAKWWGKCRMGAQGTDGFAEVLTNGGWRAVTRSGAMSGEGAMNYETDMIPYIQEMADWLDDDRKVHPCTFENAYKGCEIMLGLCQSAIQGGQVALPLATPMDEIAGLKEKLSSNTVLLSSPINAKEFGLG